MNKFNISENSYGHKKRLDFIKEQIIKYCLTNSLDAFNIRMLDVGCGSGTLVTLPLGEEGFNILGIDLDQTSIDFARIQNIFRNVSFEKKTVEEVEGEYDIVLACEILEHLERPVEFLKTLSSKLKTNGILILTTPNGYGWSEKEGDLVKWLGKNLLIRRIINKFKKHSQDITLNESDKHLQKFSYELLLNIFNDSGLKVVGSKNGPVFGGPIIERTFARLPLFKKTSNTLGDILPSKMALVWYFVLKKY